MQIIAHRRNTIAELDATDPAHGVEVDIRSFGDRLVIHHDPYVDGELFERWIEHYRHGTLILNVKEEGLETRLLGIMKAHGIENFFFLDQSFPFLMRTARAGERRCAVRISEFEALDTAIAVAPLIDWTWIDCFTRFPLDADDVQRLSETTLKTCLVSPELQGRPATEVAEMRALVTSLGLRPDAVCTKRPDLWQ